MNILRTILVALLVIVSTSCGGGGGGSSWDGALNDAGFPAVAGTYSFSTDDIPGKCSDGSSANDIPIVKNFVVSQTANAITLQGSGQDVPGWTILEQTNLVGNVEHNGSFAASKLLEATVDGLSGIVRISYYLTGEFSPTGWAGDLKYTLTVSSLAGSCDYSTTFTGDKIG